MDTLSFGKNPPSGSPPFPLSLPAPVTEAYAEAGSQGSVGDGMEMFFQKSPVISKEISEKRQDHHPDSRSQGGEECEDAEGHPGDTRRKRNQLPYPRNEASHEGADVSMFGEIGVRPLQGFGGDEEILPVTFEKRASQLQSYPVIEKGSQKTSPDSRKNHQNQVHLSRGGEKSRGGNHDLAGKGKKGGFHQHEKENPSISHKTDGIRATRRFPLA